MGRLAAVVATAGAAAVAVALYRKYFRSAAGRLRIRDLYVYPIKGCRGIRVASWPVSRVGLFGDRMLMLVDTDGRFVSLRNEPGLVAESGRAQLIAKKGASGRMQRAAELVPILWCGVKASEGFGKLLKVAAFWKNPEKDLVKI